MDILKLYPYLSRLKILERKGWKRYLDEVESVSDHSYAVSFLVMVMAEKLKLDVEKCLQLSLVHDLAESKTSDITPHDNLCYFIN